MTTELCVMPALHVLNDIESPLPLEHTAIRASITGLLAVVTVSQRFRNPLTAKTDLEYLFPLPHEAAITAFELQIGERVIRASVQEIKQARQQYAEARRQGKHASLLEGRRPNLFALQLANIQPGEFIQAVTSYQQRLELLDGGCEFVFPMGLTPKYQRPGQADEADEVNAPLADDISQVGAVEISVEAETGSHSADPSSPTHALIISRPAETRFHVELDGTHLPNRDFVLRWRLDNESIQLPAWHTTGEHGYFLATFMPPVPDAAAAPMPREYIFVLDRSGSMSGEPIQQAVNALRACLRTLNLQDTFAILLFDDRLDWLFASSAVSQANVEQADALLGQVTGRGGTEIMPALEAALALPSDPRRPRLVVFLTDGAVASEAQTLKKARTSMGATRLFSFGVGPSVNRAFLQQLARIGRGEATFIGLDEDIEEAILRFQDRIAFPLLTNLSLRAEGCQIWDVYPAQLPDLYAGRPLEVVGRFVTTSTGELPASLVAQGERAGAVLEMRSSLTKIAPDPEILARLWAQARVDDLGEQSELGLKPDHAARAEIIPLAIGASLLTKYTAFLAVDSAAPVRPGKSQFIRVAHPLPEGLVQDGFEEPEKFVQLNSLAAPMMMSDTSFSLNVLSESPTYTHSSTFSNISAAYPPSAELDQSPAEALQRLKNIAKSLKHPLPAPKDTKKPAQPRGAKTGISTSAETTNIIRELARSQQLNGSWKNDVELTAAALLAFIRSGQTTQKGFLRKQTQRAYAWLVQNSASGFAGFLRALALHELADATREPEQFMACAKAVSSLPAPADSLQTAAYHILMGRPASSIAHHLAKNLDELRLVVVSRAPCSKVVPELLSDDLGRALVAALAGSLG